MNERIRELADEAGIPAIDGEWDYNDRTLLVKDNGEWRAAVPSEIISTMIQSERGLNKFAELIVKECANILNPNGEFTEKYKTAHTPGPDGLRTPLSSEQYFGMVAAEKLKENFGVKE